MTIEKVLSGGKCTSLKVNVLKKISVCQYIVGDKTGLAILNIDPDSNHQKHVEEDKGLKVVKPYKLEEDVITWESKYGPMKMKADEIDINENRLMQLKTKATESVVIDKGTSFK